jgi:hypothetical protein
MGRKQGNNGSREQENAMQLSKLVNDGYMEKKYLNCAQTVLFGANEVYRLGLEPDALKLAAGFLEEYRSQMGDIDCTPLKERYRSEELKCRRVVLKSAEILEGLIEKELSG